jgi:hypothetical protein
MLFTLNTAVLNGEPTLYGTGTCSIAMAAIGVAQNQVLGSGAIGLGMVCTGAGKLAVSGSGAAGMALGGTGSGNTGLGGGGTAAMAMACTHGIPDALLIPISFNDAHPAHRLLVESRPGPVDLE